MGQIARALGQTEVCFVLRPDAADADFRLRWFTPVVEVDLCAHATIAAYVCLVREGRISATSEVVAIRHQTRRGTLGVWVRADDDGRPSVLMSMGVAALREAPDEGERIARMVGLASGALDPALPIAIDDASARVIVPVRRLADLHPIGIDDNLALLGLDSAEVTHVVVSHGHPDHFLGIGSRPAFRSSERHPRGSGHWHRARGARGVPRLARIARRYT